MGEGCFLHCIYRGVQGKSRTRSLGDAVYERVKIKAEARGVSHYDSRQLHAIIHNFPSQALYIFLPGVCVRELMSGEQGHPVTREDTQSDGVLYLLPLVSPSAPFCAGV